MSNQLKRSVKNGHFFNEIFSYKRKLLTTLNILIL